jgi:acid stress chaperone HdeA
MMRSLLFVSAVAIAFAALAPAAGAKTVNPPKMTCEDFLALGEDIQPRAVAWLDGYAAGGKLKEQDVGEVDVDRQTEDLVVVCKQDPKVTFWDKVKAHLPGGKKKIKPTKMTCEEFAAVDDTVKPEAVYWAEGYNAGVKQDVAGQVDLERDIGVVVVECKQAPKERFWTKVKKFFHH